MSMRAVFKLLAQLRVIAFQTANAKRDASSGSIFLAKIVRTEHSSIEL